MEKQRILITGITGFVGSHLADLLLSLGRDVYGTMRWRSRMENIEHIKDKLNLLECDIRDSSSVANAIEKVRPDKIFHLAAQSFVPTSWHSPAETLTTNIIGELNIFEAVRKYCKDTTIQIAGSSEEYGIIEKTDLPIDETVALRPLSPYGVSKVTQDVLAQQYYQSYGLRTIITRAFNHTGPRRGDVFVCSSFAKQIAEIEKGLKGPVIYVGNLEAQRDFTDVRDMVKAYWLATEYCNPGEPYNICSGVAYSIKEILDILLSLSVSAITIKQDPDRMRPSDLPILLGDSTKFRKATTLEPSIRDVDLEPEIPLKQTLEDLLNYWRRRIK